MKIFQTLAFISMLSTSSFVIGGNLRGADTSTEEEMSLNNNYSKLFIPYQEGHKIGDGVNVMTGRSTYAIIDSFVKDRKDIFSERGDFISISSSQEMKETTEKFIEADASAFGATVSASMKFILDSKSTSHDLSLITSTTVEAYIETIDARSINNVDDTLLSDLVRFRDEDNLHGFVQKYGTHYISGMKYGGSAQSRLTISTTSQKVKEEFAGSLTAAYKSVGSSGSAKYKEELSCVMERSDTRIEKTHYLRGAPLPGIESTDIDEVLAALGQFGKEIDNRHNDRNPYPLSVICDEWETIKEIRDILGDKTLLPHVADGAINAITSEYGALSWASHAANALKQRPTIWNQTPDYIQESFRKQNGEYIGSVQSDMKRIRDLSFADMSVIEPNSTEFDELFGQASVYEKKINELSDGQLRVKWSFITGLEIEYNGPLNGSVAVNFDKTISGEPDGNGYGEIFSTTI